MRGSRRHRQLVSALATATLILTIPISGIEARERRICLFDLYIAGTGGSVLCEEPVRKAIIDTACQAFEPIRYSRSDTDETKRAIRGHNAAWDALCKDK